MSNSSMHIHDWKEFTYKQMPPAHIVKQIIKNNKFSLIYF